MLYHRRVLPQPTASIENSEVERWVAHWDGSPGVRSRLAAIGQSSAAVVLFWPRMRTARVDGREKARVDTRR